MTMTLKDSLLPEFDHEMAVTRRVLERVPDHALAWTPHEKSFTLAGLATHIAQIPYWGEAILDREFYDVAQGGRRAELATGAAVLETFDRHVTGVRRRLLERSDAELLAPWVLRRGAQVLMSMPRISALRSFLLHHLIHHRGQLTVYLRLQNVPLPPLYGSTADEQM
jgi:uncharacterized damage-inducible protein DinB